VTTLRIGTWNLAGHFTDAHREFVLVLDCDVLLLTEVSDRLDLPGYSLHTAEASMAKKRRWAAIAARSPVLGLPDPHTATAMAQIGDIVFASSILPWRGAPSREPWAGTSHGDKTVVVMNALEPILQAVAPRLVWGGDWNHAVHGREFAGSIVGRKRILGAADALGLVIPTEHLPHCIDGVLSIDHIALPSTWRVTSAERVVAQAGERRLSDHDAYVVQVTLPSKLLFS
jgi:hypothetical protein